MPIDLYAKSQQLLEMLANSIHDRDPRTQNPFFFNINELHKAEQWLKEFIKEIKEDCICLESPKVENK
jgi:hypothetical protein